MKVCFPVNNDQGVNSVPHNHFGNAKMFFVVDTESNETKTIKNGDLGHEHGKCQPIQALQGEVVDAVVVGGIGQGAINKLHSMGIKVFKAEEGTISDNIKLLDSNKLKEYDATHVCNHHNCGHH